MYENGISVNYSCAPFTKYLCYSLSAPVHLRMKWLKLRNEEMHMARMYVDGSFFAPKLQIGMTLL